MDYVNPKTLSDKLSQIGNNVHFKFISWGSSISTSECWEFALEKSYCYQGKVTLDWVHMAHIPKL